MHERPTPPGAAPEALSPPVRSPQHPADTLSQNPRPRRKIPWRRALLFRAVVLLFFWGLLEAASLLILSLSTGSWAVTQRTLGAESRQGPMEIGMLNDNHVIHPYLGFVHRHRRLPNDAISSYGFKDSAPPIHQRSPKRLIIGILGGSVAEQFCLSARRTLQKELERIPEFAGREFVFVQLAIEGYKQPQQLMAVSYHLALGAEFDILIALDGFNEVCLPPVENIGSNVFAAFPRNWQIRVTETSDPPTLELMSLISYRRAALRNTAKWFKNSIWRHSPTCTLAWLTYNERLTDAMLRDMVKFNELKPQTESFAATGPDEDFDSPEQMYERLAAIWAQSSLQLRHLAEANGARYFHFLQPNQYVEGSKPIGDEEAHFALSIEQPYAPHVVKGYPALLRAGETLRKQGVAFYDLTPVFRDHPEPIYVDSCCHVNERGNEVMAAAIAQAIAGHSAQPAAADPPDPNGDSFTAALHTRRLDGLAARFKPRNPDDDIQLQHQTNHVICEVSPGFRIGNLKLERDPKTAWPKSLILRFREFQNLEHILISNGAAYAESLLNAPDHVPLETVPPSGEIQPRFAVEHPAPAADEKAAPPRVSLPVRRTTQGIEVHLPPELLNPDARTLSIDWICEFLL